MGNGKQGHAFFYGGCCDVRRAVIIVNINNSLASTATKPPRFFGVPR
jgi:hypothetical protein